MRICHAFGTMISGIFTIFSSITALCDSVILNSIFQNWDPFWKYFVLFLIVLFGCFLIIISLIDLVSAIHEVNTKHSMKFRSDKFMKFFSKWYSGAGSLSIICDDLEWIEHSENDIIFASLKKKASDLYLFLAKNTNTALIDELRKRNAHIHFIPDKLVDRYTFSCLSAMGNSTNKVIVRDKTKDGSGKVIFEEVNNSYISRLLDVFITQMKESEDSYFNETDSKQSGT